MDHKRSALGLIPSLICICFAVSCAPNTTPQTDLSPEILKWIKPGTDIIPTLSENNAECPLGAAKTDPKIQLGRAAFRSPFLLGGQATRQGLTCQACHMQGQRSSEFLIEGLSEDPGTADVTNFHFSDDLGDDVFNPSRIPSLSDDVRGVDYTPESGELEKLVTRLITKEFNGDTPHPDVFVGLLAYLRALDVTACGTAKTETPQISGEALLEYHIQSLTQMFNMVISADYASDPEQFMIAALRYELGNLYRHYPNNEGLQTEIAEIGQRLSARTGAVSEANFLAARDQWKAIKPTLKAQYSKSLFHAPAIRKWVERRSRK